MSINSFFGLKLADYRIIDMHTHITELSYRGLFQLYHEVEQTIKFMDRVGIDKIVTSASVLATSDMVLTNNITAKYAQLYPERIYGYIHISPYESLNCVSEEITKYKKNNNFIGLKLLSGYHGNLNQTIYEYSLDFAVEVDCPVLVHVWGDSPTLTSIDSIMKKRPDLKLILAHQAGGTAYETDRHSYLFKEYSNVYMDTCGSFSNTYTMEEFVNKAGEDRVLYSSDLVYIDPRYELGKVLYSKLSNEVKRKLFSENFLKLTSSSQLGVFK